MIGGVPYYYANEVYYTQSAGGYVVVEPPGGVAQAPPMQAPPTQPPPAAGQMPSEKVFIYPRQGQTHYDPTQPPAGVPAAQMSQKRADYQRAMGACLDGRGYTVK
jgi:hypothetical protein